jgi:hypothetical protein
MRPQSNNDETIYNLSLWGIFKLKSPQILEPVKNLKKKEGLTYHHRLKETKKT